MHRVSAALIVVVFGAALYAGEPIEAADVNKWVDVTAPRDGTQGYERFWQAANHSDYEWHVSVADGRVIARNGKPPSASPDFPLGGEEVPALIRLVGYKTKSIQVNDGWLVAYNAGEWGGTVIWYSVDGKTIQKISNNEVNQFVPTKDGVYAITGLAHLGLSYGSVVRYEQGFREWRERGIAELPGCGWAGTALPDGKFLVVADDSLVRVTREGTVETVRRGGGLDLYPNSGAVGPRGEVYIGARQFVGVFDPKDQMGWVRLRAPKGGFFAIPKK